MIKVIGVHYNNSDKIFYYKFNDISFDDKKYVIVESDNGERFAEIVTSIIEVDEKMLKNEVKNVIRIANKKDMQKNETNLADEKNALEDAIRLVNELNLDMNILNATFSFDRRQLAFNFMSSERIDFRELAKKLASIYKTRIELRQIGVRDKAKCIGGYGVCGNTLCCSSFLEEINSVSINMAKNQNLSLNPQKINGVCGRLMCCLSYENDCYSDYKKHLPKIGSKIEYNGDLCKVIEHDTLSLKYKIETPDLKVIELEVNKE